MANSSPCGQLKSVLALVALLPLVVLHLVSLLIKPPFMKKRHGWFPHTHD